MPIRTIQSPGVEFTEIDNTQRAPSITGTNTLVQGYTTNGVPYKPLLIADNQDLLNNYGIPSNEAERYFHYACKEVIDNKGKVWAAKLPYQNVKDQHFSYIPLSFTSPANTETNVELIANDPEGFGGKSETLNSIAAQPEKPITDYYVGTFGEVSNMSLAKVDNLAIRGEAILSDLNGLPSTTEDEDIPSGTNFILVDKSKGSLTGPKERGGKFIVMVDMLDALVAQRSVSSTDGEFLNVVDGLVLPPTAKWVSVDGNIQTIADASHNFTKALSATVGNDSVSRDIAQQFETIEFNSTGDSINTEYKNYTALILCEATVDPNNNGKINISIQEAYFGSLCSDERNSATGQLEYLPLIVNSNSNTIAMYHVITNAGDLAPYQIDTIGENESFVVKDGVFTGTGSDETTNLPAGSQANEVDAVAQVNTVTVDAIASDVVTVTINGTEFSYTSVGVDNDATAASLGALIIDPAVTVGIVSDVITITSATPGVAFTITSTEDIVETVANVEYMEDPDSQSRGAQLVGFSEAEAAKLISSVEMLTDMDIIQSKLDSILDKQVDIVCDAGLSTIAQFINDAPDVDPTTPLLFDPAFDVDDNIAINSPDKVSVWKAVSDKNINFCSTVRKDCMAIVDSPRNLAIRGMEKVLRDTAPSNTFSNSITPQLRFISNLNSSYAAQYANWEKKYDQYSGLEFWMPPSCSVAGIYTRTDIQFNFWSAPSQLNRGVIRGINDLAFQPKTADGDALYTRSINYAKTYSFGGHVIEGQKTTQIKPSAFDRVNVRRLFLRLERETYKTALWFVGELNNEATRRRFINLVSPLFESVKSAGGIEAFKIVADEDNNGPEIRDANELVAQFFVVPAKAIDFIRLFFIAEPSGTAL